MIEIKRNVPTTVIQNCKCYKLEKKVSNSNEYFVFDTKIIMEFDENDPLNSKFTTASFYVKPDILKSNFSGMKPTDLVGQYFDLHVDFVPFNRSWTSKEGNKGSKTEWSPYVNELFFAGQFISDADDSKFPAEEEIL